MAIAAIRRKNESNERLIGRWKKKALQAGVVSNFREKMYFQKKVNPTKEKERAIIREKFRAERRKRQFYA